MQMKNVVTAPPKFAAQLHLEWVPRVVCNRNVRMALR
jgi:hypothetical protein